MFIEYSDGTTDDIWQNSANFQASLATVSGSFTLPAGVSSFRVGTEIQLDSGWLAFSDLTLTGWSDTIAIMGGYEHMLDLHLAGDLQAAQGQGGKVMAHYPGSSANPEILWQNPVNFSSGGTTVSQTFTPPAGITEIQLGYMVTMDKGWLAFSEPQLQWLAPGDTITRKTYALAGKAIATRISGNQEGDNGLFYIHADHLGSTSVMSYGQGHAQQGAEVPGSPAHYLPFGDWRVEPGHELTDQGFTGHKHNDDLGLVYMNARFYISSIGRFASADTLVPDRKDPQQFNRYTYVLNNPLRYTDPTGHCAESYAGTDNDFDAAMLRYCVESVLILSQHWGQTDPDWDYLPLIRWMMQYADIDTVLSYYDQEELAPLEDMPTPPQGPQGCIRLHGGVEKCAPDGGWPKYYPLTEQDKEFLQEAFLAGALLPVGSLVGKLIKRAVIRIPTTTAINHGILKPIARCTMGFTSCGMTDQSSSPLSTDLNPSAIVMFNSSQDNALHPPFTRPNDTWRPPLQYFDSSSWPFSVP